MERWSGSCCCGGSLHPPWPRATAAVRRRHRLSAACDESAVQRVTVPSRQCRGGPMGHGPSSFLSGGCNLWGPGCRRATLDEGPVSKKWKRKGHGILCGASSCCNPGSEYVRLC